MDDFRERTFADECSGKPPRRGDEMISGIMFHMEMRITTCAATIALKAVFGALVALLGRFVWERAIETSLDGRDGVVLDVVVSLAMFPRIRNLQRSLVYL